MTDSPHIGRASAAAAAATAFAIGSAASGIAAEDVRDAPEPADVAAHWAARATLANAVMFSGLGEPLAMSMATRDAILAHAGYVMRPAMPDMAMVGAVYAAGDPHLAAAPDFSDPQTLRWDPATFDRTLEPAAQAWTLIKITSPAFHLNFHDRKEDRHIALLMLPQARAQAAVLENRLLTDRGPFAARGADTSFAEPRARDQAVVLWGASNLILASTDDRDDYWHGAWRDLVDADDYRGLADRALTAVAMLAPESAADRALAVEALGRYALATADATRREEALSLARGHADALLRLEDAPPDEAALAVYGLVEASRLFGDDRYATVAARLFRAAVLPAWDDRLGVFRTGDPIAYTPATTAAVVAALNAMRWYGPPDAAADAARLYPTFLDAVLVDAGLLLASPSPLVPAAYREDRWQAAVAHPDLPSPGSAMVAPVFAGEVRFDEGAWRVSDPRFRTADAMFLACMLTMPREGQADAFLPADRLERLAR